MNRSRDEQPGVDILVLPIFAVLGVTSHALGRTESINATNLTMMSLSAMMISAIVTFVVARFYVLEFRFDEEHGSEALTLLFCINYLCVSRSLIPACGNLGFGHFLIYTTVLSLVATLQSRWCLSSVGFLYGEGASDQAGFGVSFVGGGMASAVLSHYIRLDDDPDVTPASSERSKRTEGVRIKKNRFLSSPSLLFQGFFLFWGAVTLQSASMARLLMNNEAYMLTCFNNNLLLCAVWAMLRMTIIRVRVGYWSFESVEDALITSLVMGGAFTATADVLQSLVMVVVGNVLMQLADFAKLPDGIRSYSIPASIGIVTASIARDIPDREDDPQTDGAIHTGDATQVGYQMLYILLTVIMFTFSTLITLKVLDRSTERGLDVPGTAKIMGMDYIVHRTRTVTDDDNAIRYAIGGRTPENLVEGRRADMRRFYSKSRASEKALYHSDSSSSASDELDVEYARAHRVSFQGQPTVMSSASQDQHEKTSSDEA